MTNSIRKITGLYPLGHTPPRQPDYPDELSAEQLEAIRKLAGCGSAEDYTPLHAPAW